MCWKTIFLLLFGTTLGVHPLDDAVELEPVTNLREWRKGANKNGRIILGLPASDGQFPWQVALTFVANELDDFCGGAVLSDLWVLTAAHCTKGVDEFTLRFGTIQPYTGGTVRKSSSIIAHPGFNSYYNYDIALIKLDKPIEFTSQIQPIRLPTRGQRVQSGMLLTVSGWGKTSDGSTGASPILNYVDLNSIKNSECAVRYGTEVVVDSTLCCLGNPYENVCNGDSGGPLVQMEPDGNFTHVGIVSFINLRGCAIGAPSGFLRTESMLDWIAGHTGIEI